jgi:hypothetical protein
MLLTFELKKGTNRYSRLILCQLAADYFCRLFMYMADLVTWVVSACTLKTLIHGFYLSNFSLKFVSTYS